MKNTITFDGSRTFVSSTGNVERFDFLVTSTCKITESAAQAVGNIHGMGGQDFSCEYEKEGDLHVYLCKATCYCD
jgi:hypothetical protein